LGAFCGARANRLDSLLNQLKKDLPDTERVNILNALTYEQYQSNIKKAYPFCRQALTLARKINFGKGITVAYLYFSYLAKAEGNNDLALAFADSGLAMAKRYSRDREELKLFNTKGNIYGDLGDLSRSLNYYMQMLPLAEKFNESDILISCYNNVGTTLLEAKKLDDARKYYGKAMKIAVSFANPKYLGNTYNNLGSFFIYANKIDSAIYFFALGANEYKIAGYLRGQAYCDYYLGYSYGVLNQYAKALEHYEKAAALYRESSEVAELPNILNCIADIYLKEKKPEKALASAGEALKISTEQGSVFDLKESYGILRSVYYEMGDYKTAYDYYSKYNEIKDSLFTIEGSKQVTEMQTKYETEKKENENKMLQEKNENNAKVIRQQRYFGIAVGLICILLVAFAVMIFRSNKQKHKANLELERKNHLIEKQKEIVEEKQKEILDSIHYAKRIQRSLLTSERYIGRQMERLKKS
jgi:tetratricopeptide (TPR) repeat protein